MKSSQSLTVFSLEELNVFTDNFNQKNFISKFQFGKVYRGFIDAREVTVKVWKYDINGRYLCNPEDNEERMKDEVYLLGHPKFSSHPNLVTLIGYCSEGDIFGVVYDLKSLDNVRNLIIKDDLSWYQRIKIAVAFACFVRDFHAEGSPDLPQLIGNINADHLMLDQDYNLKVYDFSMISGGIFPDRSKRPERFSCGCIGYRDPRLGKLKDYTDVFAFGVVLLMLICNNANDEPGGVLVDEWAKEKHKPRKSFCLVPTDLKANQFFYLRDGRRITALAMECVEKYSWNRPSMDEVVDRLLKLRIVRRYVGGLGVGQLLHGHHTKTQNCLKINYGSATILILIEDKICLA